MNKVITTSLRLPLFLVAWLISACSMQFISDFDLQSMQDMRRAAKMVDSFYIMLEEVPPEQRTYDNSKEAYAMIKAELNALKLSQEIRPLNELTTKQVQIAIDLWQEDISFHKKYDSMSDFVIGRHRSQFNRLFRAMIQGEQAKPSNQQNSNQPTP